jgi:hypothetical protein
MFVARIERAVSRFRQKRRQCGAVRWKSLILALSLYGSCSLMLQSRSVLTRMLASSELPSEHRGHDRVESDSTPTTANTTIFNLRAASSSVPLQRLHEYIRQHSDVALRSDPEDARLRRRYAVAYYSCPHQAGNRLHHLFNSVFWSVVLNRTVLVHYYTREACEAAGAGFDSGICRHANRQDDCDPVLRRHAWVPTYDAWKGRLGLPNVTQRQRQKPMMNATGFEGNGRFGLVNGKSILDLNSWSTRGPSASSTRDPWQSSYEAFLNIDSRLAGVKIVDFPQMLGQDARHLFRGGNREQTLATDEASARARDLLSLGVDYLYGMVRCSWYHKCGAVAHHRWTRYRRTHHVCILFFPPH